MKNVIIMFFLLLFISCNNGSYKPTLCPKLNSLLEHYIEHDTDMPVITITFSKINGMNIVFFTDADRYDNRRADYYYYRGNRLVVLYSTNTDADLSRYINKDSLYSFNGKIPGYQSSNPNPSAGIFYTSNYETKLKAYQIINADSITARIERPDNRYIARDSNAIKTKEINTIINDYINKNPSVMYLLKFKKIDRDLYFIFENSSFYETKNLYGFFKRNNHLIVLYNINEASTIVKEKDINKSKKLEGFKESTLGLDWLLNNPVCYKIGNNKVVRRYDFMKICDTAN